METKNRLMDRGEQWREEGEGGRYGERNMNVSMTICNIDSQWEFAL